MTVSTLWPPVVEPKTLTTWVRDDQTVAAIPGMARGLQLYGTLMGQMPLDQVKDGTPVLPRPGILAQPDPLLSRFNFVDSSQRDWWLHGNTCSLVVARNSRGLPSAVKYFPAHAWSVPFNEPEKYYLHGKAVDAYDVVHVQRGVDPSNPRRGLGVVEQHLRSLERIGLQETYEADALSKAGVPSVAVIAPQKDLTQDQANAAGDAWIEKYSGQRRPAILPNGTQVQTLSWNPSDQELVTARQLSLTDLANLMNLDAFWLGAPNSSHQYKSAGPMFTTLIKTSLARVLTPFEDVWSRIFSPYGSEVRFDRLELTRDDFASEVTTGVQAVNAGLMTVDEWRIRMGLPPVGTPETTTLRVPTAAPAAQPDPEPAPAPTDDDQKDEE